MWLLIGTASAAAPPAVSVEADGTVVGVVVVAAEESAVRSLLADPQREAALSPFVREVLVDGTEGGCTRLRKKTRGLLRPFELVSLRCPTDAGWREQLVESADFTTYGIEWRVAPADGGTRVEYRVTTTLSAPLPASAVSAGVVDATKTLLANLLERAH